MIRIGVDTGGTFTDVLRFDQRGINQPAGLRSVDFPNSESHAWPDARYPHSHCTATAAIIAMNMNHPVKGDGCSVCIRIATPDAPVALEEGVTSIDEWLNESPMAFNSLAGLPVSRAA